MKNFVLIRYLTAILLVAGLLAGQKAVGQQLYSGNVNCQDIGLGYGFKIDQAPPDGTYTLVGDGSLLILTGDAPNDPLNSITITNSNGVLFDWASTLGIDAVIVKAQNSNVYFYDPESFSDESLHAPEYKDISHVEFCYDYELTIEKTAETSYTRKYNWEITKEVSPDEWEFFQGDKGTSLYTVSVDKTGFEDIDFDVEGMITITNNTPFDATITGISDFITGNIVVTPDCGVSFPFTLEAGDELTCYYYTELPDKTPRTNTVTVTTSELSAVGGGTATADVTFGDPTTLVNEEINVTDTNGESWGPVSDDTEWTYTREFSCADVLGTGAENSATIENTATIVETEQFDKAEVTVTCYDLTVEKDANTSLTRTWNWTIEKSVDPPVWNLFTNDEGISLYTIKVDKVDYTDSDWAVEGDITITNNHPSKAAVLTGVTDVVSTDIAAGVTCTTLTIPAGESITCTYTKEDLPDGSTRTNTATATLQNYNYLLTGTITNGTTEFSGTATVDFSEAEVTEVNPEINVTDDYGTPTYAGDDKSFGPFTDDATSSYERTFSCAGLGGFENPDSYTILNTAKIDETGQSDDAEVTVNCWKLKVEKNAATEFTREYEWMIEKLCYNTYDPTSSVVTLSAGQILVDGATYEVTVDAMIKQEYGWKVSGEITIYNPAPIAAVINSLSDVVSPNIAANVDCGETFPFTLLAGESLTCDYDADLPDGSNRENTATAVLQNHSYSYNTAPVKIGTTFFEGTADVLFDGNTTIYEIDDCVEVSDTYAGSPVTGTVCVEDAPKTYTYTRDIGPYTECGTYTIENTVTCVTNDQTVSSTDNCDITVEVPCDGCTLTPGYWKTHSINGPAPYDDTWAYFDPDGDGIYATFFLSGQSWYDVLWTPSTGGNAYYILASAYIAAKLNFLNDASSTPEVDAAFAWATGFFETYGPSPKPTGNLRKDAIAAAETLDAYNNGEIGPGHCDVEEETYSSTMSALTTATDQLLATNGYRLGQNIPNPFTGVTTIPFVLPEATHVRITLFNYNGQMITVLLDGNYTAGEHHLEWRTPADLSPGMYFYRMQTPAVTLTKKMNVMR